MKLLKPLILGFVFSVTVHAQVSETAETPTFWALCGKKSDLFDDNRNPLLTAGDYERVVLEPGWLEKAIPIKKRNVLVPALFPGRQNLRAWINSYDIMPLEECEHFQIQASAADYLADFQERKDNGEAPSNFQPEKKWSVCAKDGEATIYSKSLKETGVAARQFEKLYLEADWQSKIQTIKLSRKVTIQLMPVAFPQRGFERGYLHVDFVRPILECGHYQDLIAEIDAATRRRDEHAIALSDQYGGYASAELQRLAFIRLLDRLNAPQRDARTRATELMRPMVEERNRILLQAKTLEEAAAAAEIAHRTAYGNYTTALAAVQAAVPQAAAATTNAQSRIAETQLKIDELSKLTGVEERAQIVDLRVTILDATVAWKSAVHNAADLKVKADEALVAAYEAAIAGFRARIEAVRARAEANRYRLGIFPLKHEPKDYLAVTALEQKIRDEETKLPAVRARLEAAKAERQAAYVQLRVARAHLIAGFILQHEMSEKMKALAALKEDQQRIATAWREAQTEVDAAMKTLNELSNYGRNPVDHPNEFAEAQRILAEARRKAGELQLELAKGSVKVDEAKLAAERKIDHAIPGEFAPEEVARAEKYVERSKQYLERVEEDLRLRTQSEKDAKERVEQISKLLRELHDANKEVRRKKRKSGDADIEATVADNKVLIAQREAQPRIAEQMAIVAPVFHSDSRIETHLETAAHRTALTTFNALFVAEQLALIEPLKVTAAELDVAAAKAKLEYHQARLVSAELILKIQIEKNDPNGATAIAEARDKIASILQEIAKAEGAFPAAEAALKQAQSELAAADARVETARAQVAQGDERVLVAVERLKEDSHKRLEAAAAAKAAEQAKRDEHYKKMAALYNIPGFETSRTEAARLFEKLARKRIKEMGGKIEENEIPWQEMGLHELPGEIPEELIEEMVGKYSGKNCRTTDTDELKCMACNLWYEARGESYDGMMLAGRSVMNRLKSRAAGNDTVCEVIYQWKWYSWANVLRSDPNAKKMPTSKAQDWWVYPTVMKAAIQSIQEDTPYVLNHYWAVGSSPRPWQSKAMCKLTRVRIDKHYACYLPLGEDPYAMSEIKQMLANDPELLGREG